jgi:hypothetical protein
MVNYEKLAEKAKMMQIADKLEAEKHKELRADPCNFFEKVKAHILEEMNKANVELRKWGAATLDRNFLPAFSEEILLTYGTDSLCRVGLGIIGVGGGCRVTAIISGPPNGYEISRREYLCVQEASCSEVLHLVGAELTTVVACPDEIAVDIISGILVGKFN